MSVAKLVTVFAVVLTRGCRHTPDLNDEFRPSEIHLGIDQRLRLERAAPIIVLGHVLTVEEIGEPEGISEDPRLKAQLTLIEIQIEEIIKGSIPKRPVKFFYFKFSPHSAVDLSAPRYDPGVGQRRIYFLRRWGESYRTVGDVVDCTLQLRSGTHENGFCSGKDASYCIAELLLLPGLNVDVTSFAAYLAESAYVASVLCSPVTVRGLLKKLAQHPDKRISAAACTTLVMPGEKGTVPWRVAETCGRDVSSPWDLPGDRRNVF